VKFVGSLVAHEASLADGTPLAPGVEYDLSPQIRDDPHNARLIAEGQLLAVNNTDKAREEAEATVQASLPPEPPVEVNPLLIPKTQTTPPVPNGGSS
jgi:hypothetical protein